MFRTILQISFRNLVRQTRRSVLLGTAIAFGAMILVVANSFSRGISDVLFNQIIAYVAGHVSVNFSERGNYFRQIFYDREMIDSVIDATVPDIKSRQEAIGVFGRAIGNGKSDNVIVVGFSLGAEMSREDADRAAQNFKIVQGRYEDLADSMLENPVIIAEKKAKFLNVKIGDVLKVRFVNALGQEQAARMTLVGMFKPANTFMAFPIFVELNNLKPLMGYGPHCTAPITITIKDPRRNAARFADSLHARLSPLPAIIPGLLENLSVPLTVPIMGFKDDSASLEQLDLMLGAPEGTISNEGVYVNRVLAEQSGIDAGDSLLFSFVGKHDSITYRARFKIDSVLTVPVCPGPVVLINPSDFYRTYYPHWPREDWKLRAACALADSSHALARLIAPQWELLARSHTTAQQSQRFRDMARLKSKAVIIDVRSMYETASAILQLEGALNLITVVAVVVLFFIILIGVVNTLRMSIRERTREIGTVRAIGMRRNNVRDMFVVEATLLALFSSIAGSFAAFGVMALLKLPLIDPGENPMGMLLVNGHVHFVPSIAAIAVFILLICGITAVTAWVPARRAARMQPTQALRHFE